MFQSINNKLSNAKTLINYFPIVLKNAQGIIVTDINNKKYIDCILAAGSLPLGHNHSIINNSLKQFSLNNYPVQTMDIPTELQYNFLNSLYNFIPQNISNHFKIQMCSPSGSDTIEAAIKLSKIYTKQNNIVSFSQSYHGQSYHTLSLSDTLIQKFNYSYYPNINILPYPTSYSYDYNYFNKTITSNTSAVIFEPIQGEGGVNIPNKLFIQKLRQITTDLNIPLIADEVQTGFCRTGQKFAFQHFDIIPDMICLAKAIGGSQPLACLLHHQKFNKWKEYNHAGTWRGNQLAFLTGKNIIDYMQENKLWNNAHIMGQEIIFQLNILKKKYNIIHNVRGKGLMIAFDIINNKTKKPDKSLTLSFQKKCMQNGLLLLKSGKNANVIRIMCPLNIKKQQINEIIFIINKSLSQL
tara:strand:+ start:957 stop:2186 length:1230 start_codon:yes stop_codon:yes gene_type:complete